MNNEIISIDSAALSKTKESINDEITNVLENLYNNEFEKGVITCKIQINKKDGKEIYLEDDPDGNTIQKEKTFKKPTFKSVVTSALKLENKVTDEYEVEKRLVKTKEGFILEEISNPQISLNEIQKEKESEDANMEEIEEDSDVIDNATEAELESELNNIEN